MDQRSSVLNRQYKLRFGNRDPYRDSVWKILCSQYFSKHIPARSVVLDVGCGWGEFINNISAARKFAMDLNSETGQRIGSDVTFLQQDCALEWALDTASLDVVFTSNFLEHLPDKRSVEATLAQAYRCLKAGGTIICLGPNVKCIPGDYWDFWDHHIPITEASLAELLTLSGFTVESSIARFLPYSMSNGRNPPLFLVSLYLRMPAAWYFFGKQFLVIGRKADGTAGVRREGER
jgi:SAM-dependent methyltransferase